jgi:hypothetical protein
MKLKRILLLFISTILFTLACITGNTSLPLPAATPTETRAVVSTLIPSPTHTALSPLPTASPQMVSVPLWVTEFSSPIIAAVANRRPDFQDDFSRNRGWFNLISGTAFPLYAELKDEALLLTLPEKTKDSILFNPMVNRRNFILTLELRFDHNQPDDTVRFQFDRTPKQSIALDLSNNRNWKIHWGSQDNWQSIAGVYEHFPPERIPVTIIVRGTQCAVYFNNDPLTYLHDCNIDSVTRAWAVSFRLLRDNGSAVVVNFDNLKLWDLDKVPDLP